MKMSCVIYGWKAGSLGGLQDLFFFFFFFYNLYSSLCFEAADDSTHLFELLQYTAVYF